MSSITEPQAPAPPAEKRPESQPESERKADGDSLKTILDQDQRHELTQVIAEILVSMRKVVTDSFDASVAFAPTPVPTEGMAEDAKTLNTPNPTKMDPEQIQRQKELQMDITNDLRTFEMIQLKKDAISAFDEWRNKVVNRLGDVISTAETTKQQVKTAAQESPEARPQAPDITGKVTDITEQDPSLKLKDIYPPVKTSLTELPLETRALILHSILLMMLSLEQYSATSRILMLNLTSSLKLPRTTLEQDENATAKGLLEAVKEMSADEETKKRMEASKDSRKWKVGLASLAGAAVIGITGGLAAPLVAAGIGSVLGGIGLGATAAAGYLGAVAGSTVIVGSLFGAYGGKMTSQMMERYTKEVEDFQFLPVHKKRKSSIPGAGGENPDPAAADSDHKLRVTIGISGWLTQKSEVIRPWRVLGTAAEVFALKFEIEAMLNMGHGLSNTVKSYAWTKAKNEVIKRTLFAGLNAAMWPIGLMQFSRVIDNPFNIAKLRSEKAGEVLADALINKVQGERPVTLIGYSLGARAIFFCLKKLAERKAFGLVENAVLIGAATPSDTTDWRIMRTVVSGRLINVYSENDYILGFMYRTTSVQLGVAGLSKIEGIPGVENVDVSSDVDGHLRYRYLIGSILKKVGFDDINMAVVEEEKLHLQKMIDEEKDMSMEAQKKRAMRFAQSPEKKSGTMDDLDEWDAEEEAKAAEAKTKAQTEKNMMGKAMDYFYNALALPSEPGPTEKSERGKEGERILASGGSSAFGPAMSAGGGSAPRSRASSKGSVNLDPNTVQKIGSGSGEKTGIDVKGVSTDVRAAATKKPDDEEESITDVMANMMPDMTGITKSFQNFFK